jgi:pilus assembly protein TadC
MRVLIEVLHVLAGLAAALLVGALAAWSYPLGRGDIWLVTYAGMIAVAAMGVGPIRRAIAEDRAALKRDGQADD